MLPNSFSALVARRNRAGVVARGAALAVTGALVLLAPALEATAPHPTHGVGSERRAKAPAGMSRLPLFFEPNHGQAPEDVDVIARSRNYATVCSADTVALVPVGGGTRVHMRFVGARSEAAFAPRRALSGRTNYLLGNDASNWVRGVPHFGEASAENLLPGVDVALMGAPGRCLRYDLHLAAGTDPADVRMRFDGAESVSVGADGALLVRTEDGVFRHSPPQVHQDVEQERRALPGRFLVHDDLTVGFDVADRDPRHALVIDPTIEYLSYLGGTDFEITRGMAVDRTGAAYVFGDTQSGDLSTVAPLQADNRGQRETFICKVNPAGNAHVYLTYLGGDGDEEAKGIAVDAGGAAYVAGRSESTDFPTERALQSDRRGLEDPFVAKLAPDGGSLLFSTYYGGSEEDEARAITLGPDGAIHVTGFTRSDDFPTVAPLQPGFAGGSQEVWVAKFAADGASVLWATYLGGTREGDRFAEERGNGIAVASDGGCIVCGSTASPDFPIANAFQANLRSGGDFSAFVTKLSADGHRLVFSTFLGGRAASSARGVSVGSDDSIYVTGRTSAADFPVAFPIDGTLEESSGSRHEDVFVSKLSADGQRLVYSTFLGGSGIDVGHRIAVDADGAAYVSGKTFSDDFPQRDSPFETTGERNNAFALKINPAGSALVYSAVIEGEGNGQDIAVDAGGSAYVALDYDTSGAPVHAQAVQPEYAGNRDGLYVKLAPQAGNVAPEETIRSFLLPKTLIVRVGAGERKPPGVTSRGFFDTGPGEVDFTAAATVTLGPRTVAVPGLTPIRNGRSFRYREPGFQITVTPAATGSSKAKYRLSLEADLADRVDLDGAFTLRYVGGGIDAEGTVILAGGRFRFGRVPGTLVAPNIDIRKAKAKLPGVGRHAFKFVAGIAGDGVAPSRAPATRVGFGDLFAVDLAATALRPKKSAFVIGGPVGAGVKAVNLDFGKERIAVRGGNVDLGNVPDGPTRLLLVVTVDGEERAVEVRAVRRGKLLKY